MWVSLSGLNSTFLYQSRLKRFVLSTPSSARAIDGGPRRFTEVVLNAWGVGWEDRGQRDVGGATHVSGVPESGWPLPLSSAGSTSV